MSVSRRTPDRAPPFVRAVALAGCVALIAGLLWLDRNRAGPANAMARCNLLLSRVSEPAADVLVIGSSRTGVTLDPVALEEALSGELRRRASVDRLVLGRNPLRTMGGLLENYLETRGSPSIAVLEVMFMTERSVKRLADYLAQLGVQLAPEDYIYLRDVNLLRFEQLLGQSSVAMPFTRSEGVFNLWSQRLKGVVLRSGALIYQAVRHPNQDWALSACTRRDWRWEAGWPPDFAFSYGEFEPATDVASQIEASETDVARIAEARSLSDWQLAFPDGLDYPYDFEANYRQGEVSILSAMIERLIDQGVEVVLLPLPLYGYELDHAELLEFASRFPGKTSLFDLYGAINVNFDSLWYDDGHIERSPVGQLTTALMAQRLLESPALGQPSSQADD